MEKESEAKLLEVENANGGVPEEVAASGNHHAVTPRRVAVQMVRFELLIEEKAP